MSQVEEQVTSDDGPPATPEAGDLWARFCESLRAKVTDANWSAWLAPLSFRIEEGPKYILIAPNFPMRDLVEMRFRDQIEQALTEVTGEEAPSVVLVAFEHRTAPGGEEPLAGMVEDRVLGAPSGDNSGNAGNQSNEGSGAAGAAVLTPEQERDASDRAAFALIRASRGDRRPLPLLNARYTFEDFVIGGSNRFAQAAAQHVAEDPAKAYNPLFIYGMSGLGKTHLLHAIGHYICNQFPRLTVCYVSVETFLNEFIEAIRTKDPATFKRRYRNCDVLLVDDIQLLRGKKETQEEFFHTFNSLYEHERQIVITSDRHPRAIETLEERLTSRFEGGLITDIQPPGLETRVAILRKKAERQRTTIPEAALEMIATAIKDNIRELEGALIRLAAYASIHQVDVTPELTSEVLRDVIGGASREVMPDDILEQTAKMFGFTVEELIGASRRRPLVVARQIAVYLFRELTDYSYPAIGAVMGDRDHTTIMHAYNKIAEQMSQRSRIYEQVTTLIEMLKKGE
ncbi:MAG TPA: chromosomal replication initiator protein DnaA [Acidimicrobiales bacterium]|nr:chromosomal replication initiator protein DnaA [Acidimicrobiales bacterium]HUB71312.1 chromosomal replication initiator protein DnaA [Acidimicrobiales bacterium]